MHLHELDSDEGLVVRQRAGRNALRDYVGDMEVSVSEMCSVGVATSVSGNRSTMIVRPLRLMSGALRPRIDPEPIFHPNAYYLVMFTGPSMRNDKYYQFDREGNFLK